MAYKAKQHLFSDIYNILFSLFFISIVIFLFPSFLLHLHFYSFLPACIKRFSRLLPPSQASQLSPLNHLLQTIPRICPLSHMHHSILPHIFHPLSRQQFPLPFQKILRNHAKLLHHILRRQPHLPVHPKSLLHALLDARLDCICNQSLRFPIQFATHTFPSCA